MLYEVITDGEGNKVGILLDNLLNLCLIGKLMGIILEFNYNLGASPQTFLRRQGIRISSYNVCYTKLLRYLFQSIFVLNHPI